MSITIAYERVPGFPREEITPEGISIVDKFQCAYADRVTLAKEMLGFVVGSTLHLPDEYDAGDEPLRYVYAKKAEMEPLGGIDTNGDYSKAFVTIHYGTLNYDAELPDEAGTTVFVSEGIEPSAEFITLGRQGLYFGTGATAVSLENANVEAPARVLRMIDWVYTIHRVPYLPSAIWTHVGCVNNAAVYSRTLNKTFAAETLLCGNPSLEREFTSAGVTAWTITFRFSYRPEGWNKFPRTDNAGAGGVNFEAITDGTNAIPIYPLANFGQLIL